MTRKLSGDRGVSERRGPARMTDSSEILKEVPLFQRLSHDELHRVAAIGSLKDYPKGEVIFLEGESFSGFYVIIVGTVKVYKLSSDGSETVLHLLNPYKSFAETPALTGSGIYPACAQAVEDSTLLHLPATSFRKLMEQNSDLAIKISEAFASRLMELNRKFGQLSASVEGKLARFMINEISLNGTIGRPEPVFTLGMSKKDLAALLGIAVETLSRNLRKMKEEKIIREVSKKIFITDLGKLRSLSH